MKYILNEKVALREWNDDRKPYGIIIKKKPQLVKLSKTSFEILKLADGQNDIPQEIENSEQFKNFLKKRIIHPAEKQEKLSEWQKYKYFDNPNFNTISLRLTGKCNFNCKHCFNAADINTDNSQWSYEEAEKLIKEASDCGIRMFRLTGGEPMLHPDFLKIARLIAQNDIVVQDILTNGAFLNQEILDEIKKINKHATFIISFDCLHHHDWMRGKEGSESKTIEAIKLCIANGFNVFLNVQANRITMDTLTETAEFFDKLGVTTLRFIRTTESPRWREFAGNAELSFEEYFDLCVSFLKEYYSKEHKMHIIAWQFGSFISTEKTYQFVASKNDVLKYKDTKYSCPLMAETISLGADGRMYPCHQVSGFYDYMGWTLPNVKEVGLKAGMTDNSFLNDTRITLGKIAQHNTKCRACLHFKQCTGGCRACATGLSQGNDKLGSDPFMCSFYEGNYIEKVAEVLQGWKLKHKPLESHYESRDLLESACELF